MYIIIEEDKEVMLPYSIVEPLHYGHPWEHKVIHVVN